MNSNKLPPPPSDPRLSSSSPLDSLNPSTSLSGSGNVHTHTANTFIPPPPLPLYQPASLQQTRDYTRGFAPFMANSRPDLANDQSGTALLRLNQARAFNPSPAKEGWPAILNTAAHAIESRGAMCHEASAIDTIHRLAFGHVGGPVSRVLSDKERHHFTVVGDTRMPGAFIVDSWATRHEEVPFERSIFTVPDSGLHWDNMQPTRGTGDQWDILQQLDGARNTARQQQAVFVNSTAYQSQQRDSLEAQSQARGIAPTQGMEHITQWMGQSVWPDHSNWAPPVFAPPPPVVRLWDASSSSNNPVSMPIAAFSPPVFHVPMLPVAPPSFTVPDSMHTSTSSTANRNFKPDNSGLF